MLTHKRAFSCVSPCMDVQGVTTHETLSTLLASKTESTLMLTQVIIQRITLNEKLPTNFTLVTELSSMQQQVVLQCISKGEPFTTSITTEAKLLGVLLLVMLI